MKSCLASGILRCGEWSAMEEQSGPTCDSFFSILAQALGWVLWTQALRGKGAG